MTCVSRVPQFSFFQCPGLVKAFLILIPLLGAGSASAEVCVAPGTALLPNYDKRVPLVELPQIYSKSSVVLLGEHHDNAEHHRWQLQMITALHVKKKHIAITLEMFPRKAQAILDRWVAGELSESDFIEQSGWNSYWRFDPDLYMPIFKYARMNNIPLYAANVERSLIQKAGKMPWNEIPEAEREGVSEAAPAKQGYKELLANVFMSHQSGHDSKSEEEMRRQIISNPGFDNFVASQQAWDRAMAERIRDALNDDKRRTVISLSGSGHMMFNFGIPEQLEAMGIDSIASLIPWDPEFECQYIKTGFADAVVGLYSDTIALGQNASATQDRPLLGVFLDSDNHRVTIKRVIDGSVAEGAGIKAGDTVIEIGGKQVHKVEDVIDMVKSIPFGVWLPLVIERDGRQEQVIARFPQPADAADYSD